MKDEKEEEVKEKGGTGSQGHGRGLPSVPPFPNLPLHHCLASSPNPVVLVRYSESNLTLLI